MFAGGLSWEAPLADYEWVFAVNVWGVLHGVRAFVPRLLAQGEGHVLITASMASLTATPFAAPYTMSKHAVLRARRIAAPRAARARRGGRRLGRSAPR